MRYLSAIFFCLWATAALGQGQLENPTSSSNQSGQGIISGWRCFANRIEVVIDNTIRADAAYGTPRGDTQGTCGDANNGFGLQINWNILGDGSHTIVVLADGQQFGQATFTVKTLGVPYLSGASGSYQLLGFAGKNVTVQWSQPLQNFVITGWSPSGGGNATLADLLGRWTFTYEISSTFTDHYLLPSVSTTTIGTPIIVGIDLDEGGSIGVVRTQDIVSTPVPYQFALLDPDVLSCDFYLFNKSGANTVSGQYYLTDAAPSGECGELLNSTPRSMTGLRTSSAVNAQSVPASSLLLGTQKQSEARAAALSAQAYPTQEEPPIDPAVLTEILRRIQK